MQREQIEELLKDKVKDCNNTNSIFNTKKYIEYEDTVVVIEKLCARITSVVGDEYEAKIEITPYEIFVAVANYYNEDISAVLKMSREPRFVRVRKMFCYITKEIHKKKSLVAIGAIFNYDHATVLHHWHDIDNLITGDYVNIEYKKEVEEINKIISRDESK